MCHRNKENTFSEKNERGKHYRRGNKTTKEAKAKTNFQRDGGKNLNEAVPEKETGQNVL